ncbi:MAG: hypothetical protein J0L64_24860 [Acidobacteria bacterium]|nr:hypothetical protein [Acidobacteriota bacterium]
MRVLFDHSVPAPLRHHLREHAVTEAHEQGWQTLSNGELLTEAENAGFDVLVTADKNIRYQQNLSTRRIALVVLGNPRWPVLRNHAPLVAAAVAAAMPGSYHEVTIP